MLQLTNEWRELLERLRERRRVWTRLENQVQRLDAANTKLGPYEGEHALAHQQRSDAWIDLYDAIKQKRSARISWEIYAAVLLLLILLGVGTFAPLLALDQPSSETQWRWVAPSAGVILALMLVLARATWIAQRHVKDFKLGELLEWRLEDYELQIEAWEEEDRRRDRERAAKKSSPS